MDHRGNITADLSGVADNPENLQWYDSSIPFEDQAVVASQCIRPSRASNFCARVNRLASSIESLSYFLASNDPSACLQTLQESEYVVFQKPRQQYDRYVWSPASTVEPPSPCAAQFAKAPRGQPQTQDPPVIPDGLASPLPAPGTFGMGGDLFFPTCDGGAIIRDHLLTPGSPAEPCFWRYRHRESSDPTVHAESQPFPSLPSGAAHLSDTSSNSTRRSRSAANAELQRRHHRCTKCLKRFKRPQDLKRHFMAVHIRNYEHECHNCKRRFCRKDTLKRHQKAACPYVKQLLRQRRQER